MSSDRGLNGELRYAPVPAASPVRALQPRARLLPALSTTAVAAAGGFLAGAAALVTLRAARGHLRLRRGRKRAREARTRSVVATRSFLVDVHLLGR